jgi:hypothetical protein
MRRSGADAIRRPQSPCSPANCGMLTSPRRRLAKRTASGNPLVAAHDPRYLPVLSLPRRMAELIGMQHDGGVGLVRLSASERQ